MFVCLIRSCGPRRSRSLRIHQCFTCEPSHVARGEKKEKKSLSNNEKWSIMAGVWRVFLPPPDMSTRSPSRHRSLTPTKKTSSRRYSTSGVPRAPKHETHAAKMPADANHGSIISRIANQASFMLSNHHQRADSKWCIFHIANQSSFTSTNRQ